MGGENGKDQSNIKVLPIYDPLILDIAISEYLLSWTIWPRNSLGHRRSLALEPARLGILVPSHPATPNTSEFRTILTPDTPESGNF